MLEHLFKAMGSTMLALVDGSDQGARELLRSVPAWFETWEQALSRFRPESELAQLNAAGRLEQASPALWDVIEAALWAAHFTDGLVNPLELAALEAAGYTRSFEPGFRPAPTIAAPVAVPAWSRIVTHDASRSVILPPGARLDLGGVAKGWAAAEAARLLSVAGPALVDAGGDIAVSGPMADGSAWPIAIDDPHAPGETIGVLLLSGGAVATSGRDYRRWRQGERERHHIIDPRSGEPADTDVLSATVLAPTAAMAESAAKAALILGSREGMAWIEARPQLAALLVLENGQRCASRTLFTVLDGGRLNSA
jgi:thiamine biosynthesis lipoprotein